MRIFRVLKALFHMTVLRWKAWPVRILMFPIFLLLVPLAMIGLIFFRRKTKVDDPAAEYIYPLF